MMENWHNSVCMGVEGGGIMVKEGESLLLSHRKEGRELMSVVSRCYKSLTPCVPVYSTCHFPSNGGHLCVLQGFCVCNYKHYKLCNTVQTVLYNNMVLLKYVLHILYPAQAAGANVVCLITEQTYWLHYLKTDIKFE